MDFVANAPVYPCPPGPLEEKFAPKKADARHLSPGERAAVKSDEFDWTGERGSKLAYADLSVAVSFHSWFIPIQMQREFRFHTELR
jgi:hypothetical protein